MKMLIAALLLVLLVAGCVGQGAQPTGGAATGSLESDLQGLTDDINGMNVDSSDLSAPGVDFGLP